MNRNEAKVKDRRPARERCLELLNRTAPVFPAHVADQLGMHAGAVHSRMWELCLEGKANRVDIDGEMGYYLTRQENLEACAAHYQAIQAEKDIKAWGRYTEKILPHVPANVRTWLKRLKNEINKKAS